MHMKIMIHREAPKLGMLEVQGLEFSSLSYSRLWNKRRPYFIKFIVRNRKSILFFSLQRPQIFAKFQIP